MPEFERINGQNNWINRSEHDVACSNIVDTTFSNTDTLTNLSAIALEQIYIEPTLYTNVALLGRHLIPIDHDNRQSPDATLYEMYKTGLNLALATLDALCEQRDIDTDMFRRVWQVNGLVSVVDINSQKLKDASPREKYEAAAQYMMVSGQQVMDNLGEVYDPLFDAAAMISPTYAAHPGIIRSSFGYIFGSGIATLNRIIEEQTIKSLTETMDFESALNEWSQSSQSSDVNEIIKLAATNHEAFADRIDTEAFYISDSVEAFIGQITQVQLEKDEKSAEILNALALLSYPNELGNFALDELGEAFFYGGMLALKTVMEQTIGTDISEDAVRRSWRGMRTHAWLYKLEEIPDSRHDEVDEHVINVLNRTGTLAYDQVLTKICQALEYEEEDEQAFFNGFHYVLTTGNDALKSCEKSAISKQSKKESRELDAELKKLLEG